MDVITEIQEIQAREILDSRGNPTVEAEVILADGPGAARPSPAAPPPASTKRSSCATATRQRYLGKGVLKAVDNVNGEIAAALGRHGRRRPERDRPDHDRARRHREQRQARRERHPGGFAGGSARRGRPLSSLPLYRYLGGANASMLPAPMMNILNGGAHADNNVDFQEFMVMPVGARIFFRSAALGRRGLPHSERRAQEARLQHRGRRRRRLRADPQVERRSDRSDSRSHHQGGLQARRTDCHRPRSRGQRVLRQDGKYVFKKSDKQRRVPTTWCASGPNGSTSIPSFRSKTAWPKTIGTAGRTSPTELGDKIQLVGDDLFVTNIERSAAGNRQAASPTRF